MQRIASLLCVLLLYCCSPLCAQDQVTSFPADVAWRFRNFTNPGSCVQCSIGMGGWWQNVPQATYLLYDTDYGPGVYHGSNPSRVSAYCDRRGIAAYNITGSSTYDWMKWASKTGRLAAIGCYGSHFQTLLWWNPDPKDAKPWKVKNNWMVSGTDSVKSHNEFSDKDFRRHHENSGRWVVILKSPPPPVRPKYVAWWQ